MAYSYEDNHHRTTRIEEAVAIVAAIAGWYAVLKGDLPTLFVSAWVIVAIYIVRPMFFY